MLPLKASDAPRAQILFRSLATFFEPLRTCYVVVPDEELDAVRACLPDDQYEALPETELVPELPRFRRAARLRARLHLAGPQLHGWYVQQLLKLAVAERVRTAFYLTLDADVICVRPTTYEDLVRGGRAVVQTAPPNHPEWNDDGERVLGLPRLTRQYGVTPALLSPAAVRELVAYLELRAGPWRTFLLRSVPWTEYVLYYTFLEQTGSFDRYHVHGGEDAVYGNSVWIESQFDEWDPLAATASFSVVQSATRIPPAAVCAKVRGLLTSSRARG